MTQEKLSLHSVYLLRAHFDPAVLAGREILREGYVPGERSIRLDDVVLEGPDRQVEGRGKIVAIGCAAEMVGDRTYTNLIKVTGIPVEKNRLKIIATPDGMVIGVVVARTLKDEEDSALYVAPADALFNPPPEHVRESLKGKFDRAVLAGREIVQTHDCGYACVTDASDDRVSKMDFMPDDVEIDGVAYTGAWRTCSYSRFGPHFAQDGDVGKLVVARGDITQPFNAATAPVVGVVAAIRQQAEPHYGRPSGDDTIQTTYIVPARTLVMD
ncbi:MAG: hypothetical protein H6865_05640 [Rhodospirillales bacterium]|nr:hypothetical protein [Alphaproteobacteria bacterium]MCB9987103.1 hypothetical protein [Rhodospirillales bacterium]USO08138.1 MAG: hypothetical protein H6866_02655 [Rhodospirillales bacterium]